MNFAEALTKYKVQLLSILLLLCGLYYPVLTDMAVKWYKDPNYSYGFLIPLVSAYAVRRKYPGLKDLPAAPHNGGLALLTLGLLAFAAAYLGTESFTMGMSLIPTLSGIVLYLFGKDLLKALAFPLGYLAFMVPLPYTLYDALAFPLKLFVARCSVVLLKALGVIVWREGNIIMFPNTVFEVADACSGMRSLVSLLALGAVVAYCTQESAAKRGIVVLSAVPVAVVSNGVRVVITGVLAQYWGAKAAEGFFHGFAGMAVFGVSVVLLTGIGFALRRFRGA